MRGHGKRQPHIHAAAVTFHRRVQKLLHLRKRHNLIELPLYLRPASCPGSRRSGRCSRARSVPDGNPVPTSSKLATRPRRCTRPSVGSVMRLRIFSSVLLPAPFRPMMPTTSPRLTSKETSFSAQKSSADFPEAGDRRSEVVQSSESETGLTADHRPLTSLQKLKRSFQFLCDYIPQGDIALPLGLVCDPVFLAQIFDRNNRFAHGCLNLQRLAANFWTEAHGG